MTKPATVHWRSNGTGSETCRASRSIAASGRGTSAETDAGTGAAVPGAAPPMFAAIARGGAGLASVKVQAIEEFTNSRQEKITRITFDLTVRVVLAKDKAEPEVTTTRNETSDVFDMTA